MNKDHLKSITLKNRDCQKFGCCVLSEILQVGSLCSVVILVVKTCSHINDTKKSHWPWGPEVFPLKHYICYKLIQRFRVTGLFAGLYKTKLNGTITGVI